MLARFWLCHPPWSTGRSVETEGAPHALLVEPPISFQLRCMREPGIPFPQRGKVSCDPKCYVRVVAGYLDGTGAVESVAFGGMAQIGTSGADNLTAVAGVTALFGLGCSDTQTGTAASQTLAGGAGDGFFTGAGVLVIKLAGGGADTITTSVSMTMPDQVEMLEIASGISGIAITGGAGNDMLIGNGLANDFNGGAVDDVILAGSVTLADIYALFAIG